MNKIYGFPIRMSTVTPYQIQNVLLSTPDLRSEMKTTTVLGFVNHISGRTQCVIHCMSTAHSEVGKYKKTHSLHQVNLTQQMHIPQKPIGLLFLMDAFLEMACFLLSAFTDLHRAHLHPEKKSSKRSMSGRESPIDSYF